jgi:transcriptional regulator with XRE-family HTH domain
MIEEMALAELRQAMGLTQERLARALRINQAGVSELESRSDIFVCTP